MRMGHSVVSNQEKDASGNSEVLLVKLILLPHTVTVDVLTILQYCCVVLYFISEFRNLYRFLSRSSSGKV